MPTGRSSFCASRAGVQKDDRPVGINIVGQKRLRYFKIGKLEQFRRTQEGVARLPVTIQIDEGGRISWLLEHLFDLHRSVAKIAGIAEPFGVCSLKLDWLELRLCRHLLVDGRIQSDCDTEPTTLPAITRIMWVSRL